MKTSNKLLLGAFSIIFIAMIVANLRLKYISEEYREKHPNEQYETDSLKIKSHNSSIHIKLN